MHHSIILRSLVFFAGLILWLDGLILILQGKIHLGTILPLVIGLCLCIHAFFYAAIQPLLARQLRLKQLWQLGWILFICWILSLAGFFTYLSQSIRQTTPDQHIDAIVVLGNRVIQGQASPTLAQRLNTAAKLAQRHPSALIIVSGGLDNRETKTEAAIMAEYLQQHFRISAARIVQEDQSTSTDLNLKNSRQILQNRHVWDQAVIAIVTSDFHIPRAAAIARKQGYHKLVTVSAPTPLSTRYNAWLREYFAYISGWLLNEY
ncbi:YdcF family protein [Acinetobacter sp. WZC-1]|uniref:YdcF family protein n=1 Tax=Acinetobacter sp. WZC-1 TaxID=3459034 RepID=UPI00403D62D8